MTMLYRYVDGYYSDMTGEFTQPELVSFEVYSTTYTGVWIPKSPGKLAYWLDDALKNGKKRAKGLMQ